MCNCGMTRRWMARDAPDDDELSVTVRVAAINDIAGRLDEAKDERNELREQVATLTRERFVPGVWICPTCGFTLQKSYLHALDGTVSVDTRPVEEICQNDGASLRPQTWEQEANEARKVAMDALEREHALTRERDEARLAISVLRNNIKGRDSQIAAVKRYCEHGDEASCHHVLDILAG